MAFRLKCKKYTADGRDYLVSLALGKGPAQWRHSGGTGEGRLAVLLISDEETPTWTEMSVDEYGALPYHWFEDAGPVGNGNC